MMAALFKRLFHFHEMILLLSLAVLACVPIALSNLVRDAIISLLLPVTLLGMLLASALAKTGTRKFASGIILLLFGPLSLFVRIGHLGGSLLEVLKQEFNLIPALYAWLRFEIPMDFSLMLLARDELAQKAFTLGGRLALWLTGLFYKTHVEDPAARTLAWSIGLWLVAIWAGWQMYRNKHLLLGILPSTFLLALVLDYTNQEVEILWFHFVLLFFLVGLNNYANTQHHWDASHIDYSESTAMDTLILAGVLSLAVVGFSLLGSKISIHDILEDLRERQAASNTTNAETLGLEPAKNNYTVVSGSYGGLPRSHLITAGPELSKQVAMVISTGELPPMPLEAQVTAPRYYWRTITYQIYSGSGWFNSSKPAEDINSEQMLFEPLEQNIRILRQQVTFPNNTKGQLYWAGTLLRADVPFQAVWNRKVDSTPPANPLLDSDLLSALAPVESYQAESMLLNVSTNELRASPGVYPDWVKKQFLQLPDSVPERVLSLARDLTATEPTPYDRALAIQNYLRQFPYTLDVTAPPSKRDAADYFLFDLKRGYCDYYATTMVVLARATGLPARLVVGYANGAYDFERAEYVVTENYAHSWVEVYFANIGWVEFEPTASQPAIVFEEEEIAPAPEQARPEDRSFGKQTAILFQRILASAWLLLALLPGFALLWIGWDALRIKRLAPAPALRLLFKRLHRLARPMSGITPLNQTAHQYAFHLTERLSALEAPSRVQPILSPAVDEINQLTELYSRSLFAPFPPSRMETRSAIKIWSRLRWRLMLANIVAIKNKQTI